MEDGTTHIFSANETDEIVMTNASQYDVDNNGTIDYNLTMVPEAMFSNDTEINLALDYALEFFQGSFEAGVKLPIGELLGIEGWPEMPDWLEDLGIELPGGIEFSLSDISIPAVDIGIGPLLQMTGDLDLLSVDVFEERFDMDIGSGEFASGVNIDFIGVDTTTNDGAFIA